ncbi:MAG: STAS domain-containing protein [Cyanobacteria bacterium]|nr:STAS domain-containing protein [Cyanobacteriota bacterium]MDW8200471.1 STAS domain-containing protein [Cyanobacteriota bacterium SKYGB_h_bin112]
MRVQIFRPNRILSSESSYELASLVDDAVTSNTPVTIVVDLWDTALVDSRGLSAMMRAMQRLREIGGDIVLCGVLGQAKILLDITDTYKLFKVYDTVSSFLAATQLETSHSVD